MVVHVPGASKFAGLDVAIGVKLGYAENFIRMFPVIFEIKAVFNERRASVRVISHAIAANPGIHQRQREYKEQN
jgi:hypothetical protein